MPHVGMFAAKTHLSTLVEQALAGEEVVLTRHGEPVARIVPYAPLPPPRVFGAFAHLLPEGADLRRIDDPRHDRLPEDELRWWEHGAEELTGKTPTGEEPAGEEPAG